MQTQFNLLLKNPLLNSYTICPLKSDFITNILEIPLVIPEKIPYPFLFSCFALSIDGKLIYPDMKSGLNIALANKNATIEEIKADLFCLMLARSISDAIIVGVSSVSGHITDYLPLIDNAELNRVRANNNKPELPWTIVLCHNLINLNFNLELLSDDRYPVIIGISIKNLELFTRNLKLLSNIPKNYLLIKLSELTDKNQLGQKNFVIIDENSRNLLKRLRSLGFRVILNESPFSHHYFLEEKLLDEVWLNYSGSYIGGVTISLGDKQKAFTGISHPDTEILTLHHINYHFLYTRQKIIYPA